MVFSSWLDSVCFFIFSVLLSFRGRSSLASVSVKCEELSAMIANNSCKFLAWREEVFHPPQLFRKWMTPLTLVRFFTILLWKIGWSTVVVNGNFPGNALVPFPRLFLGRYDQRRSKPKGLELVNSSNWNIHFWSTFQEIPFSRENLFRGDKINLPFTFHPKFPDFWVKQPLKPTETLFEKNDQKSIDKCRYFLSSWQFLLSGGSTDLYTEYQEQGSAQKWRNAPLWLKWLNLKIVMNEQNGNYKAVRDIRQ